jgi:hypothetical protein
MSTPRIDSYRFGHLIVDGRAHTKDVIILPDKIIAGWWRKQGHALLPDDLEEVLAARLDLLVVGLGVYSRMNVTAEAKQALEQVGIEVVAQSTKHACETYNQLRDQRAVAAALHLTC